jgi:hypothetical protein
MILPPFKGPSLRGAILASLRRDFCLNKKVSSCLDCLIHTSCPVCHLIATVDEEGHRGHEVPRPFTIEPILDPKTNYAPGEVFTFGLSLLGESLRSFPYIILAARGMGQWGLGQRHIAPGRFQVTEVWAVNPLQGKEKLVYQTERGVVDSPDLPITQEQVLTFCQHLQRDRVRLRFLTPLRLISQGALVRRLSFRPFVQRLFRRLSDLSLHFTKNHLKLDFPALLDAADRIVVEEDKTTWQEVMSFSSRLGRHTPIGGLVGEITFCGELGPFLPYIVWGQFTHIGKDTTKGNGWYEICN